MKELDNFIVGLTDHELAIFFAYRYEGFLKKSKIKIENEIKNRDLSSEKLKSLSKIKLNNELHKETKCCPRCGSKKLFMETDYREVPVSEFSSAEVATDSNRCRLCGYNPNKSNPKNFTERIRKVFKKTKMSRINKWNEL